MFTKAVILLLIGCQVILATPVENTELSIQERSLATTVARWWRTAVETIKNFWKSGKEAAEKALTEIKERGQYLYELGKKLYDYLAKKGKEIAESGLERIMAERDKWVQKIQEATSNALNEGRQILLDKLRELEEQAAIAVTEQIKEALQKWEQWKQEAQDAYETEKPEEEKKE